MMRRVVAKPEVCVGCHLCEIWCVVAHSTSKDVIKAFLYERDGNHPRITVEENLPETLAINCRHCDEPECMASCISGAIYKDEEGRVLHNPEKCVKCYSCVMSCPYGAIVISENGDIFKCDLCKDLEYPYCVRFCPNDALELVEDSEKGVLG
jgi:carbon-monoxide dehydrogenase iron sulfur subunit